MTKKKMMKRLFSVAMSAVMVATLWTPSMKVEAATTVFEPDVTTPTTCIAVGMTGYYYTDTAAALAELNSIRQAACDAGVKDPRDTSKNLTSSDYVALKWSPTIEQYARVRAVENCYGDTFKSKRLSNAALNSNYTEYVAHVNDGSGEVSLTDAIAQWKKESSYWTSSKASFQNASHYYQLINPDFQYVAMGGYSAKSTMYPQEEETQIIELASAGTEGSVLATSDSVMIQKVNVHKDYITKYSIGAAISSLTVGKTATTTAKATIDNISTSPASLTMYNVVYASTNSSVASVDSSTGTITGVSAGTATIKATVNGSLIGTRNVTVVGQGAVCTHPSFVEVSGTREDATCTATGKVTYKCTSCTYTKIETLDKIPHSYVYDSATNGIVLGTCSGCGAVVSAKAPTRITPTWTYSSKDYGATAPFAVALNSTLICDIVSDVDVSNYSDYKVECSNGCLKETSRTQSGGDVVVTLTAVKEGTETVKIYPSCGGITAKTYTINVGSIDINKATITVASQTYSSADKKPAPTVTYNGQTLELGTDYSVSYPDADYKNAGDKKVTITGKNMFKNSVTKTYSVLKKDTTTAKVVMTLVTSSYECTGSAIEPSIKVTAYPNGSKVTLVKGTDYTVTCSNNISPGTASFSVSFKNYSITSGKEGDFKGTFTITGNMPGQKTALSSSMVSGINTSYTYTGSAIKPTPTVVCNSKTLTSGTDYTVGYSANTNVGTATVTITGTGNYTGTVTKTFSITARSITGSAISGVNTSYEYTGSAIKPTPTVVCNSKTLTSGTDYTITYSSNTALGTATITITGKGNYTGTESKTFTITARNISSSTVSGISSSYDYTGLAIKPTPTVVCNSKTLTAGTDYTVSYPDSDYTSVGTKNITITGKGNYTGTIKKTYTVSALTLTDSHVTLSSTSFDYDGTVKKPTVTVAYGGKTLTQADSNGNNGDYKVLWPSTSYSTAGTKTIQIVGCGNYQGTVNKEFVIADNRVSLSSNCVATLNVDAVSLVYDGTEKKVGVTVKLKEGAKTLKLDTDYTVSYPDSDYTNVGTKHITVTGKGTYFGTIDNLTYSISKATILSDYVELGATSYTWDGSDKKPTVTVKYNNKTLKQADSSGNNGDYKITYPDTSYNTVGQKKITITGVNNYSGTISKTYYIYAVSLNDEDVVLSQTSYEYDGNTKVPTVTVKHGGNTLTLNTHYTVTMEGDQINPGSVSVTVTGKGGYSGTISKSYSIVKTTGFDISTATVSLSKSSFECDGTAKKPTVTVVYNGNTLTLGTDYKVDYVNNVNPSTSTNKAKVTVTGINTYCNQKTVDFTITHTQHTYGAWETTKEATCKVAGSQKRKCEYCTDEQTQPIATIAHTLVVDKGYAATCEKAGLTDGKHCSVCNTVTVTQNPITALGHDYSVNSSQREEPTYTKYGHEAGWICSRCSKPQNSGSQIDVKKFTIRYDGNGSTNGSMSDQTQCSYVATSNYELKDCTYTKNAYMFVGWNTNKNGTGSYFDDCDDYREAANYVDASSGVVTLYAQWAPRKYMIEYELDGGENNSANPSEYTIESSVTFAPATKAGKGFGGWYKDENFFYPITSIEVGNSGNITVYAKWIDNPYSITFAGNGATKGSTAAMTSLVPETNYTLSNNGFTRIGYSFVGWNTKADGKGKAYANKAVVKDLDKLYGTQITLYAQWKLDTYTITYQMNKGTNNKNNVTSYNVNTAVTFYTPTRKGYTFNGWYSDAKYKNRVKTLSKGTIGNRVLYAKWTVTSYKIKYTLKGGKNHKKNPKKYNITSKTIKLQKPTKKGYKFAGWYKDAKYKKKITKIKKGSTGTVKLYAKWKKVKK